MQRPGKGGWSQCNLCYLRKDARKQTQPSSSSLFSFFLIIVSLTWKSHWQLLHSDRLRAVRRALGEADDSADGLAIGRYEKAQELSSDRGWADGC